MSLLLDDLLDISRITRGTLELRRRTIALDEVIDAAIETARPVVDSKSHTLHVARPAEPITFFADPLRLAQVLSNLIKNAAKFTDAGGEIRVLARAEERDVVISVADNGIGIAPDSQSKLFQMFWQLRTRDDQAKEGMGIGLALARSLIELHGGRIEVRSEGVGRGSTFTVRVPMQGEAA